VEEVEAGSRPIEGVGTAVAAFVGLAARGPFNEPTLVTNWSQFVQAFGEFHEGSYLAHAVYGYFLNGGGACYVVRIGGNGPAPGARGELPLGRDRGVPFRVSALEPGPAGNDVTVEVQEASEPTDDNFKLVVSRAGRVEEVFDNVTTKRGKQNVANVVKAQSRLIQLEEISGGPQLEPVPQARVTLAGGSAPVPVRVSAEDYVGSAADRTGFAGLEAVDTVTMLAVPDLMAAYHQGVIDMEQVQAVQLAMIAHCELMGDRVAILDPPPGYNAQQVREWRVDKARYDSKYATLYYPWIKVFDPLAGQGVFVPPSGHMAGIWARSDDARGVHKAPANEVVRGAIDLELLLTKGEHDQLNPTGVNCIRAFPGRGIRIWGARTLSSDPEWRYINVRRLFNFISESIQTGTQWSVFEPNDQFLWNALSISVSSFLKNVWRSGALFGATPDEAYYVKCDAETNPPEVIDAGQVVCEVGIAPVKPAEFVIFRLSQYTGGGGAEEGGGEGGE
jgi:phage tail sheath protein FI